MENAIMVFRWCANLTEGKGLSFCGSYYRWVQAVWNVQLYWPNSRTNLVSMIHIFSGSTLSHWRMKNAWHKKTWDARSTSAPESSSPSAVISQDIFYSNYRQTNCWHSMLMPLFWLKRPGKHTMKSRGLCATLKKHSSLNESITSSVKCEKTHNRTE